MDDSSLKAQIDHATKRKKELEEELCKVEIKKRQFQEICVDLEYANKVESNLGKTYDHEFYTMMDGKEWCGPKTNAVLKKHYTPTHFRCTIHFAATLRENNLMGSPIFIDISKLPKHFFDLIDLSMFSDYVEKQMQIQDDKTQPARAQYCLYYFELENVPLTNWSPTY